MALTTSIITGRVPLPTDENLQFAELTFALSGTDTEGADVLPGGISKRVTLIDSELPAGFELWQNTAGLHGTHYRVLARWTVKDRDGVRDQYADLGIIQIGGDASYTLASLINTSVPAAIGTFWSAISQAQYDAAIQAASDAAASAIEAALYDGPKVDTFAGLAAVTSSMLDVGDLIRVIETGAVYQRVSTGGDLDYTGTGGVRLDTVGPSRRLEFFGADPTGVNDSSASRTRAQAWAAASGGTIVLSSGSIYRIDSNATPVNGDLRVVADGAWIVGTGANSIWACNGSIAFSGGVYEDCLALDANSIAGLHDYFGMRRVRAIGTGRLVACTSSDMSQFWGWRVVDIDACEQDNSGHARQLGPFLGVRRIDVGRVTGLRVLNAERRGIMLGQISNTHRGTLGTIIFDGLHVDTVGNEGVSSSAECQAAQINDADLAIIRNSTAKNIMFDDDVVTRDMEGFYIRGGRYGLVEGCTLIDAGGNQGAILLKSLYGAVLNNDIDFTRVRGFVGIGALKSRHKVEGNTLTFAGTPAGQETQGIQLMTEDNDNGTDRYQDVAAHDNAIYFAGGGGMSGGLEIGIYADFGNKTYDSRTLFSSNKIIGLDPDVPVSRAYALQKGGTGTVITSDNIAQNCAVYADIYRTQEVSELDIGGRLLDVAKIVQCRNVGGAPEVAVGLLRAKVILKNTGEYTNQILDGVSSSLYDASAIRDVVDDGSEYYGLYRQIFRQFGRGAGSVLARGVLCKPTSTYGFKSYVHNFNNAGPTANIIGGDFRLMNRIVDCESGAAFDRVVINLADFRSGGSGASHIMVTNPANITELVIDDGLIFTATGAALADLSFGINTRGKYPKKIVRNTTNAKFYMASGAAASADWMALDGSASITPI